MHLQDTIAAIATPTGQGALGIIRISGPNAFLIADSIFKGSSRVMEFQSHSVHFGRIIFNGDMADNVLLIKMNAPNSYTGENVVEITCHGGRLILHKIISFAVAAGARLAEPGEFTLRAFINGKMDLAQAEAVQELITAESELALRAAARQLEGNLSGQIEEIRKIIIEILAEVEASIDFPDEDIRPAEKKELIRKIISSNEIISRLEVTYEDGKRISKGIHIAISGKPNVGKSSLLNAILEKDRAITTHIPGTTRDVIKESLIWQGVSLQICDTAGIRKSKDLIEEEGIRRSINAINDADLIILVLDSSAPLSEEDSDIAEQFKNKDYIVVLNKADLEQKIIANPFGADSAPYCISVSALKNINIGKLKDMLIERIWQNGIPVYEESIITNARHKNALSSASKNLLLATQSIESQLSLEFTALHLRESLDAIDSIVGKTTTDDILFEIFSKFCIGK